MKNFISIIMTAYNETELQIKEAISSIQNQTYKNFELILILDNPSNIKLLKFLKTVEKQYSFIKLHINENNIGLANSLNRALNMSRGNLIARMDSDDIMLENRLEKQLSYMADNPDIILLGGNSLLINEESKIIGDVKCPTKFENIKKILKKRNCLIHPSIMFRKEFVQKIGGYRNFESSQDYDLYCRLAAKNYRIENIGINLIKYRIRENSIGNSNKTKQFMLAQYIKKLYKERIKKGKDSFDEEKIELIIKMSFEQEKTRKAIEKKLNKKVGISKKIEMVKSFFLSKFYREYYLLRLRQRIEAYWEKNEI